MPYQSNKEYTFEVIDLCAFTTNRPYYLVKDGDKEFTVAAYRYQVDDERIVPNQLVCIVDEYYSTTENIMFQQSRQPILKELYGNRTFPFTATFVIRRKYSPSGGDRYVLVEDEYGVPHRCYNKSVFDNNMVGTKIEIEVTGFKSDCAHPHILFTREDVFDISQFVNIIGNPERTTPEVQKVENLGNLSRAENVKETTLGTQNVGNFVVPSGEDDVTEFKTTIVFLTKKPGNVPDIDIKMQNIGKVIASFMNHKGGKLFIGVRDNGTVSGIEKDYLYLNSSKSDSGDYEITPNLTEAQKHDKYENKIRNFVAYHISCGAGRLLNFEFHRVDNHTVCIVNVRPSKNKPVYLDGQLYQRQGNQTRQLQQDEITSFVLARVNDEKKGALICGTEDQDGPVMVDDTSIDAIVEALPKKDEESVYADDRDRSVWHVMKFFKDGSWAFDDRLGADEKDKTLLHSIEILRYQKKEHNRLMLEYEEGRVNVVKLEKYTDKGYGKNGWCTNQNLKKVRCVNPHDMLAVFSQRDGEYYVNVVDVLEYTLHDNLSLQGNRVVSGDAPVKAIYCIPGEYRCYFSMLCRSGIGTKLNGDRHHNSMKHLLELIKEKVVN